MSLFLRLLNTSIKLNPDRYFYTFELRVIIVLVIAIKGFWVKTLSIIIVVLVKDSFDRF